MPNGKERLLVGVQIDVLACPDGGGRLRLLATIEACPPEVHRRRDPAIAPWIIEHLGLEVEPPRPLSAAALSWLPGFEPEWHGVRLTRSRCPSSAG